MARLARLIRSILGRTRVEREIAREIDFHLEMQIEQLVGRGLDQDEARRVALRDFGGVERVKEEIRDARGITFWDTLSQDLRYGVRSLARNPGYTTIAVLTLALGIGANTAIFSVIDGVLLKPLPYRDGGSLVLLEESAPLQPNPRIGISIKELYDYRAQLETFDSLVEYHSMSFILLSHGEPDRVATGVVSANFFDVLGVQPLLGRTFVDADDDLGAEPVLVLSNAYWRQTFGADPNIVGQVFEMNNRPHTVIGVLPAIPQYPRENDVYMPTSACPFRAMGEERMNQNRRVFGNLNVFGRVRRGVSLDQVRADVRTVAGRFREEYPAVYEPETSGFTANAVALRNALTDTARPMLLMLLGATGLVLLIACANVANLTLARMMRRERELAVRTALGASRRRLLRQLLTESTLVSITGGLLGLALASFTVDTLAAFVSRFTTRTGQIAIDGGVLLFTLGLAVVTGLVFGSLPALSTRLDLVHSLKEGGAGTGEGRGRHRMRSLLVLGQVAVSFVLLVGAGLLIASLYRLATTNLGYQAEQVVTAEIFGNWSRQVEREDYQRLYTGTLERLRSSLGVISAAITNAVPLAQIVPFERPFLIEGRRPDDGRLPTTDQNVASTDYFTTLGIPLLHGRDFAESDDIEAPKVAVINQAMARFWGGGDPVGSRFSLDDGDTWFTVVGVSGDVRQYGVDQEAIPQFYSPMRQLEGGMGGRLLVRAQGDPAQIAALIKDAVHAVDADVPVENIQTLETLRSGRLATPRVTALLLTTFAAVALMITVAGLAGVVATSVSQRTHEFGVRMALGASRGAVLRLVVRQGLTVVLAGLVAGVGGSLLLGEVLRSYLYHTAPTDPVTLVAVGCVFLLAGIAACLGPARRATTIDPITALRTE